jgi:hypothetical protein
VQARLVLLEVIKIFAENNWRLAANLNLESTADSLLFQWCPSLDMEEWRFCALSLNRYDRLRLLRTPGPLVAAVKEAVMKHWYLGLQKQRDYHSTAELKLGGCPWWADSNDAVESRYFISTLIGRRTHHGRLTITLKIYFYYCVAPTCIKKYLNTDLKG